MTIDQAHTALLALAQEITFGDALFCVFHSLEDYRSTTIQMGMGVEHALVIIADLAERFELSPEDITRVLIPNGEV